MADLPPEIQACSDSSEAGDSTGELEMSDSRDSPADDAGFARRASASDGFRAAPPLVGAAAGGVKTMDEIERDAILAALDRTGGRRVEAAKLLAIGLRTLQRKLKDYKDQGYYQE